MSNTTLESFPVSAIALPCLVCKQPVRGIVCFCGEDVCLPCLQGHQQRCAYTLHCKFRSDGTMKKKGMK